VINVASGVLSHNTGAEAERRERTNVVNETRRTSLQRNNFSSLQVTYMLSFLWILEYGYITQAEKHN
jgi:hypothetical protein